MALIFEGVRCVLCETLLDTRVPFFATSGTFFPPEHSLFEFCDAPLHWDCYAQWAHRPEFARAYVQMWVEAERGNPYWGQAFLSKDVLVTVNPSTGIAEVSVLLSETGSDIRVPLGEWEDWIMGGFRTTGRHPVEQQAVNAVVPLLQAELSTSSVLVGAVDWEGKRQLLEYRREQARTAEEARLYKPGAHNRACRALVRRGVDCPFCGGEDPRYAAASPEGKSTFVCDRCGESFGPVEVTLKELYG